MSEQITEEQAVQVAEWLGWRRSVTENQFWVKQGLHRCLHENLATFFYSPEGQEAVMDKLEKTHSFHFSFRDKEAKIILYEWVSVGEHKIEGWRQTITTTTRQHALLLAVLEMLKNK